MPNIKSSKKLSRTARIMICDYALYAVAELCLTTFMSAYLYQTSAQSLLPLAIFNLASYTTVMIMAVILGALMKLYNKLIFYRLGSCMIILEILIIFLLGQRVVDLVYLVGLANGLRIALYAFTRKTVDTENVGVAERLRFTGYRQAACSITSIIAPVFFGTYISLHSFQSALIIVIIIAVLEIILSFSYKNIPPHGKRLELLKFRRIYRQDQELRRLYLFEFCRGINRVGLMRVMVPVLILMQFNNDFELGGLTSVFYICNFLAMYLFGRFYHRGKQGLVLGVAMLTVVACSVATALKIDYITIILYNLAYYVPMYLIDNIGVAKLYNHSNLAKYRDKYHAEYFIIHEFYIDIGRIMGFGALAIIAVTGVNTVGIWILLGVIAVSVVAMCGLIGFDKEKR